MRSLLVLLIACGSSSNPADVPADHALHDLGSETRKAKHVRYGGKQVPLADLPMLADKIGLPVSGTGDVLIDVTLPKPFGSPDYAKAYGSIAVSCTRCRIGDDRARLTIGSRDDRSVFADGISFGHLAIDRLEIKATITNGLLEVTAFELVSADVELEVSLAIQLAFPLEDSVIGGCIRFKPTDGLRDRDPKLHALLSITGAQLDASGMFQIALEGTAGAVRRLAKDCGSRSAPTRPTLP